MVVVWTLEDQRSGSRVQVHSGANQVRSWWARALFVCMCECALLL